MVQGTVHHCLFSHGELATGHTTTRWLEQPFPWWLVTAHPVMLVGQCLGRAFAPSECLSVKDATSCCGNLE